VVEERGTSVSKPPEGERECPSEVGGEEGRLETSDGPSSTQGRSTQGQARLETVRVAYTQWPSGHFPPYA